MNLDPKKIKELITLYSELDDEYQEELFSKAKVLSIKQTRKNQILKSKEKFKTKEDLDKINNWLDQKKVKGDIRRSKGNAGYI